MQVLKYWSTFVKILKLRCQLMNRMTDYSKRSWKDYFLVYGAPGDIIENPDNKSGYNKSNFPERHFSSKTVKVPYYPQIGRDGNPPRISRKPFQWMWGTCIFSFYQLKFSNSQFVFNKEGSSVWFKNEPSLTSHLDVTHLASTFPLSSKICLHSHSFIKSHLSLSIFIQN